MGHASRAPEVRSHTLSFSSSSPIEIIAFHARSAARHRGSVLYDSPTGWPSERLTEEDIRQAENRVSSAEEELFVGTQGSTNAHLKDAFVDIDQARTLASSAQQKASAKREELRQQFEVALASAKLDLNAAKAYSNLPSTGSVLWKFDLHSLSQSIDKGEKAAAKGHYGVALEEISNVQDRALAMNDSVKNPFGTNYY